MSSLVQYNDQATGVSSSISFLSNVTKGNLLICFTAGTSASVTDTLGNTYVRCQYGVAITGLQLFVCFASKSSGANTVTQSFNDTAIAIAEFSPSVFQAISPFSTGGTSGNIAGAANQLLVGIALATTGASITGVGSGFTQEAINSPSKISLEYKALSGSGNVSSVFTMTGTAGDMGTCCFTLSSLPTPVAGTPSIVQASTISTFTFPNHVTAGNSLLATAYAGSGSPVTLGISDTLGNTWVPVMSAATATGLFGNDAYQMVSMWFCANLKSSGADTFTISGAVAIGPVFSGLELSPCIVSAESGVAAGSLSENDIVSSVIAAYTGQLLVDFASILSPGAEGLLGVPMAGFQFLGAYGGLAQVATQPIIVSGNFNSDFNTYTESAYSASYQTGVVALGFGTAATPTFSPVAGTYVTVQSVTLSCSTPASSIYYTIDGSTPTTGSTPYTGAISVSTSQTVKAIATAVGYTNSPVASAVYIINLPILAAPTFTPVAGFYPGSVTVTIATVTPGADIYFTTDGSTPTPASTLYTGPITLSVVGTTTYVQAIVVYPDVPNSPVGGSQYTITPPLNLTKLPFSKRTTAATAFFRCIQIASSNGAQWYVTTTATQRGQLSNLWPEMLKTYDAIIHQDRKHQTLKLDALIAIALTQATSVNSIVQTITPGTASGQTAILQTMQQVCAQAVTQINNALLAPDDGE